MEREYYEDIGYKPFLFYVIYGVSGEDLEVSQQRHHVDELPQGLDLRTLNREQHGDYMDGWLSGAMGSVLQRADDALVERCKSAEVCVVLQGSVKNDSSLDYMRNVIGIIQAFVEKGAAGILDPQTLTLYAPAQWTEKLFEKEVNALRHVAVLYSPEEEGYWIHTRGMAEFGRPDIGMHGVSEEKLDRYTQIVEQMIYYGGQGLFFAGDVRLHTADGSAYVIRPEFVNDFENEDYNNAYYKVRVLSEEPANDNP